MTSLWRPGWWLAACCALILVLSAHVPGVAAATTGHEAHTVAAVLPAAQALPSDREALADAHCHPSSDCFVTEALPVGVAQMPFAGAISVQRQIAPARFRSRALPPSPPPPRAGDFRMGGPMQT